MIIFAAVVLLQSGITGAATGSMAYQSCSLPGPYAPDRCTATVEYAFSGIDKACVWLSGGSALVSCSGNPTGNFFSWDWTTTSGTLFELRGHVDWPPNSVYGYQSGTFLASHLVVAQQSPTAAGSLVSNSPCMLPGPYAADRCSVTVNYSFANTPVACVWIAGGTLFSCAGGGSGSQTFDWATLAGTDLELRAHSSIPPGTYAAYAAGALLSSHRVQAVAPTLPYSAQFISQSVPGTMTTGQTATVSVTMKNTGANTWTVAEGYRLGSRSPDNNLTWGVNRVQLPASVALNGQVTFTFDVTAPGTPGAYSFQWAMVRDGVQWIEVAAPVVWVQVNSPTPQPPSGTNLIINGGFESPYTASYFYPIWNGTVVPGWSYVGGVAIQRNGSAWAAPIAPEGQQTAVLQSDATLSTSLNLAGGQYTLAFQAAPRTAWGGQQSIDVRLNGNTVYSVAPMGGGYSRHQVSFIAVAGSNQIEFVGRAVVGDNSAFIDDVQVVGQGPTLGSLPFSGESYTDYAPHFTKAAGLIVNSAFVPALPSSKWANVPSSPTASEIFWTRDGQPLATGDGQGVNPTANWISQGISFQGEEFSLRSNCAGGWPFIWQHAFTQYDVDPTTKAVTKYRYPFSVTKVLLEFQGNSLDITGGGSCGTAGLPYAIQLIPSIPYVLKVWAQYSSGANIYWQVEYSPATVVANACWTGTGASSRQAITQREAWWDSNNNWGIGSGELGTNALPTGQAVTYGRSNTFAKGAGWAWTGSSTNPSWMPCLQSTWSW